MATWSELAALTRFITRSNPDGVNKSSSGTLQIVFGNDNMFTDGSEHITVEVNGYDISNWNRHQYFGPFKTEEEAKQHLFDKLTEAFNEVREEREEADLEEIDFPDIDRDDENYIFDVHEVREDRVIHGAVHGFFSTFTAARDYVEDCYTPMYSRFMMIRKCRVNQSWPTESTENPVARIWHFKQEDGKFTLMK